MQDGNGGVCLERGPEWVWFKGQWLWRGKLVALGPSAGPARVVLPRVRTRAPGWWDVVEQWKEFSVEHLGRYEAYGSREQGVRQRAVRTEWPPVKGQAVYGWRAWWMAQRIINWRHAEPKSRYFRKMTWCELYQVAQGKAGFRWFLWQRVLNDIEWKANSEAEKLRAFRATPYAGRGPRTLWRLGIVGTDAGVTTALTPVVREQPTRAVASVKKPSAWSDGR